MAQAKSGDTVKVHYTGRLQDGTTFDSSIPRQEPLEFTLGGGQMIKGFDAAVHGMETGQSKTVEIPAAEAYGTVREDMIMTLDRQQVPPDINPEVGQQLAMQDQNGRQIPVVVTDINDSSITLDANHPLAGKDLIFEIQLVEIV
ncbi:FKBP-type peptidyl-prolyl cis-trans isomerase 2 [Catalinimonas alkaloidigena]|uniref:Peptidyl-prolyl cis-trans isomerase n=1 Tax=Catalinimonas alkaloidigena TaxID=1075417 RepID=A0A1G9AV43_9BACT|nr:peptidylprolyl isomerase [Catalinimonas alkaloidigena]SDK31073.1 FKBP-type peptidyl-prolyl cis-trans isomerase 2 [Catalinimonas alkaloidigena]